MTPPSMRRSLPVMNSAATESATVPSLFLPGRDQHRGRDTE